MWIRWERRGGGTKQRAVLWAAAMGLMVPYLTTLAWTGTIHGEEIRLEQSQTPSSGRRILLDRGKSGVYVDAEEYLPGVLAGQIPADFEMEALKAQAVIARTYIYKQMEKNEDGIWQVPESALDLDVLEMPQMKKMWGNEAFLEAYGRLEEAVQATSGQVLKWQEAYIDPMFCRASAGMTRQGDENHPYLQPVDCPGDLEAEGYLQLVNFSKGEFADRLSQIPGGDGETVPAVEAGQLPDSIQIVEREEGGYVTSLQVGERIFTGEEVQYALGLQSSAFSFVPFEDGIRAETKGIGHGYGFSQTEANRMAEEGWTAEDLLLHFYKNVQLTAE